MVSSNEEFTFNGELIRWYPADNEWYQTFIIKNLDEPDKENNAYSAKIPPFRGAIEGMAQVLLNGGEGSRWLVHWKHGKEKVQTPGEFYQTITRIVAASEVPHDHQVCKGEPQPQTQAVTPPPAQGISRDEQIARAVALKAVVDAGDVFIKGDASYRHVNSLMDNLTDMLLGRWSESHPAIPPTPEKEEEGPFSLAPAVDDHPSDVHLIGDIIEEVQE